MRLRCPSCELVLEVSEGKTKVKCPNCGFKAPVPPPGSIPVAVARLEGPSPEPPRVWVQAGEAAPGHVPSESFFPYDGPPPSPPTRSKGRTAAIVAVSVVGTLVIAVVGLGILGYLYADEENQVIVEERRAIEAYVADSEDSFAARPEFSSNLGVIWEIYYVEQQGLTPDEDPVAALQETSWAGDAIISDLEDLEPPETAERYATALVEYISAIVTTSDYWLTAYTEPDPDTQDVYAGYASDEIEQMCSLVEELEMGFEEIVDWHSVNDQPLGSQLSEVRSDTKLIRDNVCSY